jgi:hypothetical protein
MQIRFAEPVSLPATQAVVEFDAYGRRFALKLEDNERLLSGMSVARKAQLPSTRLLRGRLEGLEGSWVRLTLQKDYLAGAIWDGADLYVIARYADVAAYLVNPLDISPSQTVMFRISDTSNLLPAEFCGTESEAGSPAANNGLVQYNALVRQLKLQFVTSPTDQIDLSLVADSNLQQVYAGNANELRVAMLNTLNVVDGIYDAQLGLMVSASVIHLVPGGVEPFTTNASSPLLGELSSYRANTVELRSRAISHLFTGRVLDDNVLGIARLGGACSEADGVSLTSTGFQGMNTSSALIMAHELGHNLNAEHDTAACGNTYLMWPEYSSRIQPLFSQCSADQIKPFIVAHRGTCVTPASYGDAEARIGTIPQPLRTEAFVWPVYLRNAGTAPLTGAELRINLQYFYGTINGIAPSDGGSCAPINGEQRCTFGTLAPGAEVRVDLDLTPSSTGTVRVNLVADGSNDRYERQLRPGNGRGAAERGARGRHHAIHAHGQRR